MVKKKAKLRSFRFTDEFMALVARCGEHIGTTSQAETIRAAVNRLAGDIGVSLAAEKKPKKSQK